MLAVLPISLVVQLTLSLLPVSSAGPAFSMCLQLALLWYEGKKKRKNRSEINCCYRGHCSSSSYDCLRTSSCGYSSS